MTKDIALNDLPLESIKIQLIDSFEEVSDTLQVIDKNWKRLERFGKLLIAAKEKVPHGEWEDWLVDTFAGRLAIRTAQRWMADSKAPKVALLKNETVPRSARKPADVKVSIPADHIADGSKMVNKVVDDDPAPDPPTNRKTAAGSEKVAEDKKPRTQQVVPEILPDEPTIEPRDDSEIIAEWLAERGLTDIISDAIDAKPKLDPKTAAKVLRKHADKLDPPTKFQKPDLDEVSAYFAELKAVDAESFFDFYESKGWLVGKVGMKDWRASARKWVRENHANGKANGNGHRTTEATTDSSCLGPNGRPRVERAKVTYK